MLYHSVLGLLFLAVDHCNIAVLALTDHTASCFDGVERQLDPCCCTVLYMSVTLFPVSFVLCLIECPEMDVAPPLSCAFLHVGREQMKINVLRLVGGGGALTFQCTFIVVKVVAF